MTTNKHTPIANGASNDASTWNNPLGDLDAAITANENEIVAARGGSATLGARIAAVISAYQSADNTLDGRIDNLIINAGDASPELADARTAIPYAGTAPATLGDALALAAGGIANVLAFGADNTGATDCAAAVQAALDVYDAVYFPPGEYLFDAQVTTGSGKSIYGHGATVQVGGTLAATTNGAIKIDGDHVTIDGLLFRGTASDHTTRAAGGRAIDLDATASRTGIRILHCTFVWLNRAVNFISPDPVNPSITIRDLLIDGCTFIDLTAYAITLTKSGATPGSNYRVQNWRIVNCHFEDIYYTEVIPGAWDPSIYIAGGIVVEGLTIANCSQRNSKTAFLGCASTGAGTINGCKITGCTLDGAPSVGTTWYELMGIDVAGVTDLVMTGCILQNIRIEAAALYGCRNFDISGCTFRNCSYGIAAYLYEGAGCAGTISGCTFIDPQNPETGAPSYGVLLAKGSQDAAAWEHSVQISTCKFIKGAATGGTGIRIADVPHPRVVVSGCEFLDLQVGIGLFSSPYHEITVQGCQFKGITVAGISAATLVRSTIANCSFVDCAVDILASTSQYVRCIGNTHKGTTEIAVKLQNAVWNTVTQCVFEDCTAAIGGTAVIRLNNPLIWQNNIYAGTTPVPAAVAAGAFLISHHGTKITYAASAPASGTWAQGDVVYNTSPGAGGAIGWVCTAAGSPGTWKTWGTIAS